MNNSKAYKVTKHKIFAKRFRGKVCDSAPNTPHVKFIRVKRYKTILVPSDTSNYNFKLFNKK
jgi:hypothetical protein